MGLHKTVDSPCKKSRRAQSTNNASLALKGGGPPKVVEGFRKPRNGKNQRKNNRKTM